MSWVRRLAQRSIVASGLLVGLTGCFQPLYGPGLLGADGNAKLRSIEVAKIDGRFGHFLKTNLQFALGGGAIPDVPAYSLVVTANPTTRAAVVNSVGTTAQSVSIYVVAGYKLTRLSDGVQVLDGVVSGLAGYERSDQRFASLSANNDAEERAAKLISEQIQSRIAMAFASGVIQP